MNSSCYYFGDNDQQIAIACNFVNGSANLLTGEVEFSNYGYFLNAPATYAFLALFSALTFAHLCLGIYFKTWWTLATLALGALLETIGWTGRLQSINNLVWSENFGGLWQYDFGEFVMQICLLVIAPTFFSAANYILLGYLLRLTDERYSSLDIRSFRVIFITADVVCLLIQAGGGAWAGSETNGDGGAKLMTGGVIVQLVVTVLFIGLYAEWLHRWRNDRIVSKQYNPFSKKNSNNQTGDEGHAGSSSMPLTSVDDSHLEAGTQNQNKRPSVPDSTYTASATLGDQRKMNKRIKWMAFMMAFSSLLIVIRSVYRSIELLNGWEGPIAINEPLFLGMDAAMMAILLFAYALVHPGLTVGRRLF